MWSTQEGLYLTEVNNTRKLAKAQQDFNLVHELQLSEFDFEANNELIDYRKTMTSLCYTNINIIQSLSLRADHFAKMYTYLGESIILYFDQRNVYLPTCANITTIEIIDNATNCY